MIMTKSEFLAILGEAYDFPDYYSHNLDSADEVLEDRKEAEEKEKLSLAPFFHALLAEEEEEERAKIWSFLADHFVVEAEEE